MAKIQIDLSGRGGLAPKHYGDRRTPTTSTPNLRYIAADGQMVSGTWNPFARHGYLSPASTTMTAIGFATDPLATPVASLYDPINDDYYFAGGRQIWLGDGWDDATLGEQIDLGSTGTPNIMDLEDYQVNGARKLFFVYEKSGNVEIGISVFPYNTGTDDLTWLSVTVANPLLNQPLTNKAFMRVADNGFAYLFMDNQVHKIDGTTAGGANGTITANALLFPVNFQIVDAVDHRGKLYIAIKNNISAVSAGSDNRYETMAGVYIWDRRTATSESSDFIPVHGVKEIGKLFIDKNGALAMLCNNTNNITEVRKFNGSAFEVVEEVGYGQGISTPDGLTTANGSAVWLSGTGKIWAYGGADNKDGDHLYNLLSQIASFSTNTGGAIMFGSSTLSDGFLFSCFTTDDKVFQWSPQSGTAISQGDIYTPVHYLPQMSNVNYIDIYMAPNSGSGSTVCGTVKIYFNQSSTAWASKSITRAESATGYKRIEVNKQYINAVQLEVEYPTAVAPGTIDFAPSISVIDYSPTLTKG